MGRISISMKEPTILDAIKWGAICGTIIYIALWLLELGHAFIWGY